MDELSKIQLSLEQIRQLVRARIDLFPQDRRRRIIQEIGYAESFFESVVEEFESGCVTMSDTVYRIADCIMLKDFLELSRLHASVVVDFDVQDFNTMRNAATIEERHSALQRMVYAARVAAKEAGPSYRRYRRHKAIADECVRLALREMQDSLLESAAGDLERIVNWLPTWKPFSNGTRPNAVRATPGSDVSDSGSGNNK